MPQADVIGRLAGGVAHNFNNLLTVILVSSEMLMAQLPAGIARMAAGAADRTKPRCGRRSSDRPAARLLRAPDASSGGRRSQRHDSRHDRRCLQRVVGERVTVTVSPEDGLPPVRVDVSQIQRVILDLATHARDAMPGGGTMIVETRRVVLTEAYVAQHINVQPGVYVLLAISDTGSGMDAEMQLHLFEPFYAKGNGARARASACRRCTASSGRAAVTSGSTANPVTGPRSRFICPRRRRARVHALTEPTRSLSLPRGRASVLLVEDEPGVRAVAHKVLEACGYTVVTASSGEEALERCLGRGLEPDLLITDVVMPGITGSQLVAHLRTHRDGLRVLYTSGFTEDAVVHHGVASGEHFLSKPFTPADLAHKVREVLGVHGRHSLLSVVAAGFRWPARGNSSCVFRARSRRCASWSSCVRARALSPARARRRAGGHVHYAEPANAQSSQASPTGALAPRLQNLGSHTFPVSTSNGQAQAFMNQGLNLAYAFNHAEARRAFREAARLDPDLAMAYWGQALVLGPNINALMEPNEEPQAFELVQKARVAEGSRHAARAGVHRRAGAALLGHGRGSAAARRRRTPTRCAVCTSSSRTTSTSRCSTSSR